MQSRRLYLVVGLIIIVIMFKEEVEGGEEETARVPSIIGKRKNK